MSYTVIIPARYASARLPGKVLLDIGGKPMLQHVYEQASKSTASRVIIATDEQRIASVATAFGATVCMTSAQHPSGTDRLQEVVQSLALADDEVVVNVQGDEPLIPPANIDQVAQLLRQDETAEVATLSEPITSVAELFDPNAVKLVTNQLGYALYFSRAPIPWARQRFSDWQQLPEHLPEAINYQRHIGIYGYRVAFLHRYVQWPPAPLELAESLEQLRALWQGVAIKVATAIEPPPAGVDTEADLTRVRQLFIGN